MYKYAEIYFFNNKKCAQYIETNNIFNLKNISDTWSYLHNFSDYSDIEFR